jgi:ribose/xylose/arabinose/galactoside ABC-type transport system permease subunit
MIPTLAGRPTRGHQPQTDELAAWIPIVALLVTLAIAFLIGSFHTWLITVIELPPFVATLASLVGLRSLARLLIQDLTAMEYGQRQSTITINDGLLTSVGRENWWIACVLWLVLSAALWVLLSKTVIGRHVYAMGGNEEAARLSGIRTDRLKWLAYCLSSMTAALAGVLYACYIGATNPASDGMGYELNAIAAAVVGGCSLTGGIGTVAGVMLGTLFLRVIIDSVAKLFRSQPDLFEGLVVGVLVVLAVAFNQLRGAGGLRKPYFPGLLGLLNVAIISALAGVMMAVTSGDAKLRNGLLVASGSLLILGEHARSPRVRRPRRIVTTLPYGSRLNDSTTSDTQLSTLDASRTSKSARSPSGFPASSRCGTSRCRLPAVSCTPSAARTAPARAR